MAFKTNLSEAVIGNELKPEGDYECIIMGIEERTTKNGATGLNFMLTIRNDVEGQKYGNACLFYTLWKAKEPTTADMTVNGYKFGQIMAVGKAAALPDGKEYPDMNAFVEDLKNKCVLAHMEHEEYKGKTSERVRWLNPTNHPDCKHVFKQKTAGGSGTQFAAPAATEATGNPDDGYPFY